MRELALFAGAGGGILGGTLLGWRTVCAVEIEPYCREVLLRRQRDGVLPLFPIWDDIRTFDGRPWRGLVDVVSGGFPCQPFSVAGKQLGAADERNLWPETIRVLRDVRPRFAFVENVPALLSSGYFGTVLGDLAEAGFDAEWGVFSAAECGAPHRRERVWIMANAKNVQRDGRDDHARDGARDESVSQLGDHGGAGDVAHADQSGREGSVQRGIAGGQSALAIAGRGGVADPTRVGRQWPEPVTQSESPPTTGAGGSGPLADAERIRLAGSGQPVHAGGTKASEDRQTTLALNGRWWEHDPADGDAESGVGRVAHGVAHRIHRLKALGNGQVPIVAATTWERLNHER